MDHSYPLLYEALPQDVRDLLMQQTHLAVPFFQHEGDWKVAVEVVGEQAYRFSAAAQSAYFEPLKAAPWIDLRWLPVRDVILKVRNMAAVPNQVVATDGWVEGKLVEALVGHVRFVLPDCVADLEVGDPE